MKMVIYKENGIFKVTTEENYKAQIRNARCIQSMEGFDTAQEIIDYYCKYFKSAPENFIVIE
jgi:hypothetical protein